MTARTNTYLAFDLGASSGRALLGRLDGDRIHVEEVHRFDTPLIHDAERLYWDLKELEREVDEGLRRAVQEAPDLRSLSVDSWAVDYVPLDENGTPLRNPYSYRDPRTQPVMAEALERVPAEEIYATTGIQFMPINTLYQILADQEMEPDLVERTKCRVSIADYFLYRFSGRAVAELSMASTTQLLNVRSHRWATDLMERFGIDANTCPQIVPSATRLGALSPPAKHVDLEQNASDIEVIAGCSHDTACAIAAIPVQNSWNWAYISCGTWALLGVECSEPILTDDACNASFTNELGLDGCIRFLKNLMGLWILQECERSWRLEGQSFSHDVLQEEATQASGDHTLDLDDPRFAERGDMPQKIRNYCVEHGQSVPQHRGEFVRLILQSMVEAVRTKLEVLEQLIEDRFERVYIVGGGSQNELLCQWIANATGRPVTAGPAEATSLGNLLIQARTLGSLSVGTSVREVVRASCDLKTYKPERRPV